jgi:hypothetical protein
LLAVTALGSRASLSHTRSTSEVSVLPHSAGNSCPVTTTTTGGCTSVRPAYPYPPLLASSASDHEAFIALEPPLLHFLMPSAGHRKAAVATTILLAPAIAENATGWSNHDAVPWSKAGSTSDQRTRTSITSHKAQQDR